MNIAVLSCKNIKDETCIACHRCLMGFDKKEGEFERYKDTDAKLMGESIDAVHIGTCLLDNCPYKDTIIEKVKAKAGVDVIEGTHPYRPVQVFGD